MSLDREPWEKEFTADTPLLWFCPFCDRSTLRLRAGTLSQAEDAGSKRARDGLEWEPDWYQGSFVCVLECPHCPGEVGLAGRSRMVDERGYDAHGEAGDVVTYMTPAYFTVAPPIIEIPAGAPEQVREQLKASFALFWVDPLACANRIRASIEALLTAQRVQKSKSGRGSDRLSLHRRIELFRVVQPHLADQLLAVKWIGNAGSHDSGELSTSDALDAYEMLGLVLEDLYLTRKRRIGAMVREINRRKGPRRRPKR